ncbi:uncharacterized protein LOC131293172 [Anopheles ziemanni]|uniref:uncharacterized protein LOC131264080 n=1 Tax=Anopheles coustani TaxID=139045 RepID=UPI002657F59C|nr:uncharacterized protein LOC131264080 [Anopheles coustani]XP_058177234.1 uncharacterized protein LOC131293172 [Anopheles ziemanni]
MLKTCPKLILIHRYAARVDTQDRYKLYFYSLEDNNNTLIRALKLVDWDYSWKIYACHSKHWAAFCEVQEKHSIELQWKTITETRYMSKEQALLINIELPAGVRLGTVSAEHVPTINKIWPHMTIGTEFAIKRLILWNESVALFDESSNELLAWCLQLMTGAHGVLQVPIEHSRKGYGTIIAKAMAKKLAKMGHNSYAYVTDTNEPSRALFDKIGFQNVGTMCWARTVPRKLVEWDH